MNALVNVRASGTRNRVFMCGWIRIYQSFIQQKGWYTRACWKILSFLYHIASGIANNAAAVQQGASGLFSFFSFFFVNFRQRRNTAISLCYPFHISALFRAYIIRYFRRARAMLTWRVLRRKKNRDWRTIFPTLFSLRNPPAYKQTFFPFQRFRRCFVSMQFFLSFLSLYSSRLILLRNDSRYSDVYMVQSVVQKNERGGRGAKKVEVRAHSRVPFEQICLLPNGSPRNFLLNLFYFPFSFLSVLHLLLILFSLSLSFSFAPFLSSPSFLAFEATVHRYVILGNTCV